MIVKIQQSLSTNMDKPQMIIYDKSRRHFYEADLTDEIKKLLKDRPKAYFEARIVKEQFEIGKEVNSQNW